jgi:hypothetical protein
MFDSKIGTAMMIEPGPKTYKIACNADDLKQRKEVIGKEMSLMDRNEVFTFVQKMLNGASMIQRRGVWDRK